ncbi:MAG: carboxypeptidase-like regulatory domain-containing protein [Flavobacteriales bacterium]|nr:carboxypeptidase-like regulatory domain-containing protein [Flavobacteriales bacterium]
MNAGAHQLSGEVKDERGFPVPFASIYLENTTYGVASNARGWYYLELQPGTYRVVFQAVGFATVVREVTMPDHDLSLNVVLEAAPVNLGEVTVTEDKRDIAMEIIRKAIDKRKSYLDAYTAYTCDTYIKASLEKEYADMRDSLIPGLVKRERLNFIESYGQTNVGPGGQVKEIKTAYRDLADKKIATVQVHVSTDDRRGPDNYMEHNPYLFYTSVSDGNFNFYQNLLNIPRLGDKPYISPIAAMAPVSYKYYFEESFFEDGKQINKIKVVPRNSEGALFSGYLYIEENSWALKAVDLTLPGASTHFYRNFRIIQNYEQTPDSTWVIGRQSFFYDARNGRMRLIGNTVVVYSQYNLRPEFPPRFFDNELRRIEDTAYDKDTTYWNDLRPVTLKPEEKVYIHTQDSIRTYHNSVPYLREQDSIRNRITFWDVVANGVGLYYRDKGTSYFIYSLMQSVRPFSVGGYHHALGGTFTKEWSKATKLVTTGEVDYGFVNRVVKGYARVNYLYHPKRFGKFYVKGGDTYSMINGYESLAATFSRSNYVHKRFGGVGHEMELVNGLFLDVATEYAARRPITDLVLSQWSQELFGDSLNSPQNFEAYNELLLDVELSFTPQQEFYTEPYRKIIVGSKYPTFTLHYKKGVNGIFNSDVDYDFLQLSVEDKMKIGTLGESKVAIYAGKFLRSEDIRLVDQKFFRGSDYFFYSNPIKSFQLLGPTLATRQSFLQAHYIHHFNGALMNKVPLVKKLRMKSVGGASILFIDDVSTLDREPFRHAEAYVGLEKEFVLWRQLMKIGAYYVAADSNHSRMEGNFKFGIDFFNSFTNSWSY